MALDNISALLAALKNKEGSAPDDSDLSDSTDESPDEEGTDQDDAEDNAKIVAVLQTDYPTIYAKIAKQVEAGDDDTSGTEADASQPSLFDTQGMIQ
jgi:hypothetical protein